MRLLSRFYKKFEIHRGDIFSLAWVVLVPILILGASFNLYYNLLYSPEIAIGIPVILLYLVFVLLAGFYVIRFHKTGRFWGHDFGFLSPWIGFALLIFFIWIYFAPLISGPYLTFLLSFIALLVAFPVFITAFIMFSWLISLKKKEHGEQIVWIYLKTQRYSNIFLVLAILSFFLRPLFSTNIPAISSLLFASSLYFGALFLATILPLNNEEDMCWFCETGLASINNKLNRSLQKRPEKSEINNCLLTFPTILDVFNRFLKESKYPGPPYISRKYCYKCYKALLMSVAKTDGYLDNPSREGIDLMTKAIQNSKDLRFFSTFIKGLEYIFLPKTPTETFETPFGLVAWIERNRIIASILVLGVTAAISIIVRFLFGV